MFAKPKTSTAAAGAGVKTSGPRFAMPKFDMSEKLGGVIEVLKKPFVAPLIALTAFAGLGVIFLNVAGDPNAGSPSVRINLAKPKAAAPAAQSGKSDDSQAGMQAFTLDSLGMFQDSSAKDFNLNGEGASGAADGNTATITLPGDADAGAMSGAQHTPSAPLAQAPISGLVQTTTGGPMPVVAPNGMTPASAYARPFKSDGRPMVSLIVGGLGLNPAQTKIAIEQLPPQVTLSFVPYVGGLQGWVDQARAAGHEVIIEVPMQPSNYPDNDPGAQTLMANARAEDLQAHIAWVLTRCTGYFAVSNYEGSAFFKDKPGVATFTSTLNAHGIGFIDDGQARGITGARGRASADRIIDNQINAQAIDSQLSGLEAAAKARGSALGTGFAYPVTLAVALKWTQSLEGKGLQLAPASAVMH